MPNEPRNGMIMLGGLWLNESSAGQTYMSGRLGLGGKILIFRNLNKASDSHPDYYLFLAPYARRDETGGMSDVEF